MTPPRHRAETPLLEIPRAPASRLDDVGMAAMHARQRAAQTHRDRTHRKWTGLHPGIPHFRRKRIAYDVSTWRDIVARAGIKPV